MPETVKLKPAVDKLYEQVKEVTGMPYTEIAARSLSQFIDTLPEVQRKEIFNFKSNGESA
jgi:hypothetical protein